MRLTLGLTGMDSATEGALQAAFASVNSRLGKTGRPSQAAFLNQNKLLAADLR